MLGSLIKTEMIDQPRVHYLTFPEALIFREDPPNLYR